MNHHEPTSPSATEISKEAGLIVFGAATGMLLSSTVNPRTRKPLGIILALAGIAAAGPEITRLVNRAINSPTTQRGSRRTLDGIRNGAQKAQEQVDFADQDSEHNMFIG